MEDPPPIYILLDIHHQNQFRVVNGIGFLLTGAGAGVRGGGGGGGAATGNLFHYGMTISKRWEDVLRKQGVLAIKFNCTTEDFSWIGANVYGSNDDFLASISDMLTQWSEPWCIGGDFNIARFPHEGVGADKSHDAWKKNSEFINSNELIDMPMVGRKYMCQITRKEQL